MRGYEQGSVANVIDTKPRWVRRTGSGLLLVAGIGLASTACAPVDTGPQLVSTDGSSPTTKATTQPDRHKDTTGKNNSSKTTAPSLPQKPHKVGDKLKLQPELQADPYWPVPAITYPKQPGCELERIGTVACRADKAGFYALKGGSELKETADATFAFELYNGGLQIEICAHNDVHVTYQETRTSALAAFAVLSSCGDGTSSPESTKLGTNAILPDLSANHR